ncbi:MAG TPA: alpha-glucan family phosphorylase [Candidatus Polarisedimenticolaceae bacterium]|nr:alpha-glucan family phosphorylase [Candidatus Polarisedimenticolaceae bacterium]
MEMQRFRNASGQAGAKDLRRAAQALATNVPSRLAPLARVAYNYFWSWQPDGDRLFRDIDAYRWRLCGQNPVRFLQEALPESLEKASLSPRIVDRVERLRDALGADLARPAATGFPADRPVAFFCAEFGIHRSMPIYSGGLGCLAGDILKEASDLAIPMVGVGILYRQGYFHQRVDAAGLQHEYWYETDPERRPAVRVTAADGHPIQVTVPIWAEEVAVQVWRVDVGRVPLFLLDTTVDRNTPRQRFISARLYEGNRQVRLAQYALLGVGGMRVLRALGIEPLVVHLNEGHPALATIEAMRGLMARGASFGQACTEARRQFVFTTHTPVPAGNETYSADEMRAVFPDVAGQLGTEWEELLALGRVHPDRRDEPPGLTPAAIRLSRSINGVSRIHGEVSRAMWRELFPASAVEQVPISHVTNGAHLPSWMSPPMRRLLDRHLDADWSDPDRVRDPATWAAIDAIPDEELWTVRNALAERLVKWVRSQTVTERLTRDEPMDFVEQAARTFDPEVLTLGFARRIATYKRLHLLLRDPPRLLRLLEGSRPLQLLVSGKAHPKDDVAKALLTELFRLKTDPRVAGRVAFLEDYDLGKASLLVAGCDVWLNLPRPPLEASGTSGIKAAFNGTLNLSVLDGWWAEAYDGTNGFAIEGSPGGGEADDERDAAALFDLLERQVVPLFHERGADGIPHGWIARVKASLRTICPRFCATRMLDECARRVYRPAD